jgi:hypothetical protein
MSTFGYTTRSGVQNYLNRTFPEVSDGEFNTYISQAESYINNYCGYNAMTTTSGMMTEAVVREKVQGKLDSYNNLVIDLMKPPVHKDIYGNPMVSLIEFNIGSVRVTLNLTDGTNNPLNSVLEVSENNRKVIYPSMYFLPVISTVTPTAKVNLWNLRDAKFWVDISYIGGYDVIPADITLAANLLVVDSLIMRDNIEGATSIRQGNYSITYDKNNAYTMKANIFLQPYIRYTW